MLKENIFYKSFDEIIRNNFDIPLYGKKQKLLSMMYDSVIKTFSLRLNFLEDSGYNCDIISEIKSKLIFLEDNKDE